ncbi:MAG: hypothetical protein KF856_02335 [Cyclobacteriaceae bacterium]|nr:hypothetical protein [Cyclobacteriaceae bacterium]
MITYKHSLLFILVVFFQNCNGQKTAKQEIHNKDFNWTITIPENFENLSSADWTKMQNKGTDAIEKTFEGKVINQSKTIFVFKSDQLNYFESNYQPYDPSVDGDYLESCKAVNEILYETFKAQMPGVKIDTTRTVEQIDNLEFQTLTMKVEYPNKMVLTLLMFSRLFDKREFTVNIMFVDKLKGQKMLDSWRQSKFIK